MTYFGGTTYTVVVNSFSTFSHDNNIFWNNGSWSSWNISCIATNVQLVDNAVCTVADASSGSSAGKIFSLLFLNLDRHTN